jgi:hypothetical protein
MHTEQVVAGVNGDTSAQAIQLRTREAGQNYVSRAKLIAWDAQGQNPIVLIDFDKNVAVASAGARILVATPRFALYTAPAAQPDFVFENPIPDSYLRAGSITFEDDEETLIVCRLSWGGAEYTGDTHGALTNDDDGNFGPPFPTPIPTGDLRALAIQLPVNAITTSNAADYALTEGPAVFVNNTGQSFTLAPLNCPGGSDDADGDLICSNVDNCAGVSNYAQRDADADGAGDACDVCPNDRHTSTDAALCASVDDGGDDSGDGGGSEGDPDVGDVDDEPPDGPRFDGGGFFPSPAGPDSNDAQPPDDHDHEGEDDDHDTVGDNAGATPPPVQTGCGAGALISVPGLLLMHLSARSRPAVQRYVFPR